MSLLGALIIVCGLFFYLAGTVGMLRFPDVYSRLHAVTKADNVGLGFLCLGCGLLFQSWSKAALLLVIWLLAVTAATVGCHLIARNRLQQGDDAE